MNTIHNNGENDKSLSEGLDKLSHEYGSLEQDEPPELLDQAILNSAHRAVEKKPHWMKFGWLHGLTTAAVFVLAFSIILNQREPVPEAENGMSNYDGRSNYETLRVQQKKVAKKPSIDRLEKRLDKDAPARELIHEEALMQEADLMSDSPAASALSTAASPAVVGEIAASETKARVSTGSEAEQMLQAIIKLKQSGNESWKTELELFKESYPDYPLPEELTD